MRSPFQATGGDYYHNIMTDEVRWEKPVELQTPEELAVDSSDCVWLPSEEQGGWVPAYVIQRNAKSVTVRPVEGGGNVEVPVAAAGRGARARGTLTSGELLPLKLSHLEARHMPEDPKP